MVFLFCIYYTLLWLNENTRKTPPGPPNPVPRSSHTNWFHLPLFPEYPSTKTVSGTCKKNNVPPPNPLQQNVSENSGTWKQNAYFDILTPRIKLFKAEFHPPLPLIHPRSRLKFVRISQKPRGHELETDAHQLLNSWAPVSPDTGLSLKKTGLSLRKLRSEIIQQQRCGDFLIYTFYKMRSTFS